MKSKKSSAPSLLARIAEMESKLDDMQTEFYTSNERTRNYVDARMEEEKKLLMSQKISELAKKGSGSFDWFLIGAYAVIIIIYLLILFKSKNQ